MPKQFGVPLKPRRYLFEMSLALTSGRYPSTSSFLLNRVLSTLSKLGVRIVGVAPLWPHVFRSETLASSSQAFMSVLRASSPSPNRASTAVSFKGAACFPEGKCTAARDNALRVKPWSLTRGKASLSNAFLVVEDIVSGAVAGSAGCSATPVDQTGNLPEVLI